MNLKLIIYYTTFIKVIFSSYVKIPFYTFAPNISNDVSPSEIFSKLNDNKIYINISIGTPPQNIPVLVSLQSILFFISEGHKQTYCKCYNNKTSFSYNKIDETIYHFLKKFMIESFYLRTI